MELNTNGHHATYEMKISGFDLDYKANKVYGVVPVSYTHLDVYKRQAQGSADPAASRTPAAKPAAPPG